VNEKLLQFLNGDTTRYPKALNEKFPRIVNKIVELWGTPGLDDYFHELMVDARGTSRQGFPPEIAKEIFSLSMVYSDLYQSASVKTGNAWDDIPDYKRQEIEALGFQFTPESFEKAVEAGNEKAVGLYLSCGVDVDTRDERDWTPLMIASFNGNEQLALLLIRSGAKIQAQDKNGYSPLHWASYNGYGKVVDLLIEKGAMVNATSQFGLTALIQAAARGHLIVAAQLIAKGAYINAVTQDGWTALHKAAANGHAQVVRLLLSKGADASVRHPNGSTALALASKYKHDEVVAMLNSSGTGGAR
jgi:ankyrin repeat protein